MIRRSLAEAEAVARARIASIRAAEAAAASDRVRALAASARDRLRLAAVARDPLVWHAAAIRAETTAREAVHPLTGHPARVVLPVFDDLLTGVTEYARDIEWSRP
ncbi:hypothetical protein ACNPNP_19645 [Microbacterium sp. AGC85]